MCKLRLGRKAGLSPHSSAEVKKRRAISLFSLAALVAYERVKPTYVYTFYKYVDRSEIQLFLYASEFSVTWVV